MNKDKFVWSKRNIIIKKKNNQQVTPMLSKRAAAIIHFETIKANPPGRDTYESRMYRLLLAVERKYLSIIENSGGVLPSGFWQSYRDDIRNEIASPLRQHIEQSFSNYSDYVNYIDQAGAIEDIDTMMTQAIEGTAQGIANNAQASYDALVAQGISEDEIIQRMAMRLSAGHAEQIAITEMTRAEAYFSDALAARLQEQGLNTQIRWLTGEDEKVCPICSPADGKLKDEPITSVAGGWNGQTWGNRFGRPPAHPRCRCQTVVELPQRRRS